MDRKEIIKIWKANLARFECLDREIRHFAMEIGKKHFLYLDDGGVFEKCNCEDNVTWGVKNRYRLCSDYEEKENIIKYVVFEDNGKLFYGNAFSPRNRLHKAVDDVSFIGFLYPNKQIVTNCVSSCARRARSISYPAEYPEYVVFKKEQIEK